VHAEHATKSSFSLRIFWMMIDNYSNVAIVMDCIPLHDDGRIGNDDKLKYILFLFVKSNVSAFIGNDHTNMTAPLPVRSAKLSMFGPG
jgi:hypothetical protein